MRYTTYQKPPTLVLGLGGCGSNIVKDIYEEEKYGDVSAFLVDLFCDAGAFPAERVITLQREKSLMHCLVDIPNATQWFPNKTTLLDQAACDGTMMVRAVGRLAFEAALLSGTFRPLLAEAWEIADRCMKYGCTMRICIVTSLTGGTGSGIFIQMALLLRNYINRQFPSLKVVICGELVLPGCFQFMQTVDRHTLRFMEANTYAALKELEAIDKYCSAWDANAAPLELRYAYDDPYTQEKVYVEDYPYDYCFLHDKENPATNFDGSEVAEAIIRREFTSDGEFIKDHMEAMLSSMRYGKVCWGNSYGTTRTEKIPVCQWALSPDLDERRKTLQRRAEYAIVGPAPDDTAYFYAVVTTPEGIFGDEDAEHGLGSYQGLFKEKIDPMEQEITVTAVSSLMELSRQKKLISGYGKYYQSYKGVVAELPSGITPHLHKDWHRRLPDIGEETAPMPILTEEKPLALSRESVFISYSSIEYEVAAQVRQMLETNGISCWMAPQSIPAGSDYATEIPKSIESCKVLLLLLSQSSQTSNWVPKEVGLAISKGKTVVPFQLDDAPIRDAFNFYLSNSQRISAYNRTSEAYQELLKRLHELLD